ncbi:MAG: NADH-quinone oxidoreductase subunit C [Elusimicrobiota bacterium]|jgi:NADH:ubiquinone oxidoreductase subunit C
MASTKDAALARLLEHLSSAEPAAHPIKDYPTVRLSDPAEITKAAAFLKDELGFDYLEMITAVDWLGPMQLDGLAAARTAAHPFKETPLKADPPVTPAPGAGAAYRPVLDLLWSFGNLRENLKMFLRLEVPRDQAEVASLTALFPAADWQEREAFDLLGVRFLGHPNLTKILTTEDLAGHPLRKDYAHQKDRFDE